MMPLILSILRSRLHVDLMYLLCVHWAKHKRQCILLSYLFIGLEKKDEGTNLQVKLWSVKLD